MIAGRWGVQGAETYPAYARLKFRDGHLGEVRRAADISDGIAGNRGKFTASVLEAYAPAMLREGALEALGGPASFFRDISTSRKQGAGILLEFSSLGRDLLSAGSFRGGGDRSRSIAQTFRAPIKIGPF